MQQIEIIRQLVTSQADGIGSQAGDFAQLFFNDEDRQGDVSPDRRKVCRAQAKRAILSLKERGLVDVFYNRSPRDEEYRVSRMYVELTTEGHKLGQTLS